MNVLVTAGGTQEDIDSVRSISNKSTGRLGSIIADTFAQANSRITYVCGEKAALPCYECAEIIRVGNVAELAAAIERLLNARTYDCVIHSMAVSDFTPQAVMSIDELAEEISRVLQKENIPYAEMPDRIRELAAKSGRPLTDKKISSDTVNIALLLKQTPKVIKRIKEIQPRTLLVGFKLLSDVPEEDLLQAGFNLLKHSLCDLVLANDLADISDDTHRAILIDKNGALRRADTKQEIANIILEAVTEGIAGI